MGFLALLKKIDQSGHFPDPEALTWARKTVTLSIIVLALLLVPILWKPWIHGNDGARNYAYARSLFLDGDLDFQNEFDHYRATGDYQITMPNDPVTNRPGNALGVGSSVLWTPFFLVGHLVAKVSSASADGYSAPYAWAICAGSTFYAILGLVLLLRLICWRMGPLEALVGVLAAWLGTPLVFYMYLHPSMSHSCSFFLCVLMIWQYERWRDLQYHRHFFLMAVTCGLAIATRFNNGVFLILVLAFFGRAKYLCLPDRDARADRRWIWTAGFLTILGLIVGFFPQMAAWKAIHGSWFSGPINHELGRNLTLWKSPHAVDILLSGWRGIFIWSPITIPASFGYFMLVRRYRLLDTTIALMFLAQLWVIGSWHMWWGGASFGQRFFINFTPVFAMGIAWLFGGLRYGWPRNLLAAFLVFGVLWSAGLGVQYVTQTIPREDEVTFSQLLDNQINKVPQATLGHLKYLWPGERNQPLPHPEDNPENNSEAP